LARHREEDIWEFKKKTNTVWVQRSFDAKNSVFKTWKADSPKTTQQCLEHDYHYWKVHKFCRDKSMVERLKDIVRKNFQLLKCVHLKECALSDYPTIYITDFMTWAKKVNFIDKKLKVSTM
jgi:hypothetical protein